MTAFEKAWKTCIPIRKDMGLVRPGDEVQSPGRLYTAGRDAPECFVCGMDVYETELESCNAGGDHFYFCDEHEMEAAYRTLDACRGHASLEEGRDSVNME
tara:strand:- start:2236 stop:2535 length:300 start_codon:yes stop_codon:yes gene_type:complete